MFQRLMLPQATALPMQSNSAVFQLHAFGPPGPFSYREG